MGIPSSIVKSLIIKLRTVIRMLDPKSEELFLIFCNFLKFHPSLHCILIMTVKEYNRSVEEYADSVYRFIRGNLKDEARANDIVQDSYEKLWRHVAEIDYTVVKSWLFTTAYNNMIDIIRKEKKMTCS